LVNTITVIEANLEIKMDKFYQMCRKTVSECKKTRTLNRKSRKDARIKFHKAMAIYIWIQNLDYKKKYNNVNKKIKTAETKFFRDLVG
jgi:hypothetical protein